MSVSRATVAIAIGLLAAACNQTPSGGRVDAASVGRSSPATRDDVASSAPASPSSPSRLDLALAEGFPDSAMSESELDGWLAGLRPEDSPAVRSAWLGAAVRRAPSSRLGTVWAAVSPADLPSVVRWFAGRSREAGTAVLPVSLRAPTTPLSLAAATALTRLRPAVDLHASQDARLGAASLDEQLAAARLLSIPSVPFPDNAVLEAASPWAWPAVARSMAGRGDLPPERWAWALHTTANRCRVAPRLWCNAWRAVRDALPVTTALPVDLPAALAEAEPTTLPASVASALRCENAVIADRASGIPNATLRCASAGFEWMAASAQASVWGVSSAVGRLRAQGLDAIRAAAAGQVQVLEAVATAATKLPTNSAVALVRSLGRERDPGVLAALLEGLVLHVQHARALGETDRRQLEAAPFAMAEGPSLEARLQSIQLARALHDPDPGGPTEVRAVLAAEHPDAGIAPRTIRAPAGVPRTRLRVVMAAGEFELDLDPSAAPEAVDQIRRAAAGHRYDGLTFHRIVPGFVAQGLDPRGDGYGGTETTVATELSDHPFERATIGVPLAGLDTGGIQLFIVLADSPHLDGRYPWVGRVVRGMDVVDGLLPEDRVERVEIVGD